MGRLPCRGERSNMVQPAVFTSSCGCVYTSACRPGLETGRSDSLQRSRRPNTSTLQHTHKPTYRRMGDSRSPWSDGGRRRTRRGSRLPVHASSCRRVDTQQRPPRAGDRTTPFFHTSTCRRVNRPTRRRAYRSPCETRGHGRVPRSGFPAATPRFPFPARGRGRKGKGRSSPTGGDGGGLNSIAAKRPPLEAVCRIHPPRFLWG
jgi:hypothetical protein